jgi:hypothetical protein
LPSDRDPAGGVETEARRSTLEPLAGLEPATC